MSTSRTDLHHLRKLRGWLAGLCTIALVIMGSFVGVSAANAAELDNVITDINLTSGTTFDGHVVSLSCEWAVPTNAVPGDTFSLTLPPELNWYGTLNFPLYAPDGVTVVAMGAVTASADETVPDYVVFTLTDYISTHAGVTGDCNFRTTYNASGPGQHTVLFDVGSDIPVVITEGTPCTVNCGVTTAQKAGWWSNMETGRLHFLFRAPATFDPVTEVKFVDITGQNPGYDLLCDSLRAYVGTTVNSSRDIQAPYTAQYIQANNPPAPPGQVPQASVTCTTDSLVFTWSDVPTGQYSELHIYAQVTDFSLLQYSNKGTVSLNGVETGVGTNVKNAAPGGSASGSSIHLEKWSTDDGGPATTDNLDFPGDFDIEKKPLKANTPTPITFTITNTGDENLNNIVVTDATTDGPAITDISCDFSPLGGPAAGTTWPAGPFAPQAVFTCTGMLPGMAPGATHSDTAKVTGDSMVSGTEVTDDDPWNAIVPEPKIDIEKWSTADGGPATPGADSAGDFDDEATPKPLVPGTPTPITFTVTNTGTEVLNDIEVTDSTTAGPAITGISCDFSTADLTAPTTGTTWPAGPFNPGASFTCTGTVPAMADGEHSDTATVGGVGQVSGTPVTDDDDWNGEVVEPEIDIEKWSTIDGGPAVDDADFPGDFDAAAKQLVAGAPTDITFTITNTGTEDLNNIEVTDATSAGPVITGISCDFSPLGGPTTGTTWAEGPFHPGDAFTCSGVVPAMAAGDIHTDKATVTGTGMVSGTNVDDDDTWNGEVTPEPKIDIEKWSTADGGPATPGADSAGDFDDAAAPKPLVAGALTDITFTVTNTGNENLVDVEVTDATNNGPAITGISCDFSPLGGPSTGTTWPAGPFYPGDSFTCTGVVPAMQAGDIHSDTATVNGTGAVSGTPVDDDDDWNGEVPEVPTPAIHIEKWSPADGGTPGLDDNDFGGGDFDNSPKQLTVGERTNITFTITNTGTEDLENVVVTDNADTGAPIEQLTCNFSEADPAAPTSGTEWLAGPFEPGDVFTCTGVVPAVAPGALHQDTAKVTGVGMTSKTEVSDDDPWKGTVPPLADEEIPDIHIEKWSADDGGTPGLDDNDFGGGDFDVLPKEVVAGAVTKITFTITNTGTEDLKNIVVSDATTAGTASIADLSCDFSEADSTAPTSGTEWLEGPFIPGAIFTCTGTVPALVEGELHTDLATVSALGYWDDVEVTDDDPWNAVVPKPIVPVEDEPTPPTPPTLTGTGADPTTPLMASGVLLLAGLVLMSVRRRRRA